MRPITKLTMYALAAAAMAASAQAAAVDYFLKLGDIKGESAAKGATGGQIEVMSWQFGVTKKARVATLKSDLSTAKIGETATASGGVQVAAGDVNADGRADTITSPRDATSGMPTGKRQHGQVTMSKPLDRGSVTVQGSFPGCMVGAAYTDAVLAARYIRYELTDVVITSCSTSASGGDRPTESISLNYGKIVTKHATDADKMQWDIGKAKKL